MTHLETVLYTARTHTSGGQDSTSRSYDGRLDVRLSSAGGAGGGTNPEQLFASAWSVSFIRAIRFEAGRTGVALPPVLTIDAEVDLGTVGGALALEGRLNVSMPGMAREIAEELLRAARQSCPYCRAVRGNIGVEITLD